MYLELEYKWNNTRNWKKFVLVCGKRMENVHVYWWEQTPTTSYIEKRNMWENLAHASKYVKSQKKKYLLFHWINKVFSAQSVFYFSENIFKSFFHFKKFKCQLNNQNYNVFVCFCLCFVYTFSCSDDCLSIIGCAEPNQCKWMVFNKNRTENV